ncbi:hypothetical protein [Nostoc sp.]
MKTQIPSPEAQGLCSRRYQYRRMPNWSPRKVQNWIPGSSSDI